MHPAGAKPGPGHFRVDSGCRRCYKQGVDGAPEVPDRTATGASSPYIDPATGFLRNEVSANYPAGDRSRLAPNSCPGGWRTSRRPRSRAPGTRAHLQAIHRVLFDGIFDWAGQFRTTDIDKQGTDFVPAGEVETAIEQLFAELVS